MCPCLKELTLNTQAEPCLQRMHSSEILQKTGMSLVMSSVVPIRWVIPKVEHPLS